MFFREYYHAHSCVRQIARFYPSKGIIINYEWGDNNFINTVTRSIYSSINMFSIHLWVFSHFLDLLPLLYLCSTRSKSCGLWFSNQIVICVYNLFELTSVIPTAPVLYYNNILLCRFTIPSFCSEFLSFLGVYFFKLGPVVGLLSQFPVSVLIFLYGRQSPASF